METRSTSGNYTLDRSSYVMLLWYVMYILSSITLAFISISSLDSSEQIKFYKKLLYLSESSLDDKKDHYVIKFIVLDPILMGYDG